MHRMPARRRICVVLSLSLLVPAVGIPAASADPALPKAPGLRPKAPATRSFWSRVTGPVPSSHDGQPAVIAATRFRAFRLDHTAIETVLRTAPADTLRPAPGLRLALPSPGGGFDLFEVWNSPVMEPGLAAAHPEIRTFVGQGISDPTATLRASLTRLGFQASVRGSRGPWFVDPYYHLTQSLYVTYWGRDLENVHGPLVEEEVEDLDDVLDGVRAANAVAAVGDQLRTYRLALASSPGYATYFGAGNVTSAKAALVNRVTQIYEDETAIRLVLIAGNDALNFDTNALATGANGPCGTAPCYSAAQIGNCSGSTLDRQRIALGQVVGASAFDVGHIALTSDGGVARRGVGGQRKAMGCTGQPNPVGDLFAVDYVAHELGHQFSASHTWSGTGNACSPGQFVSAAAVEPGSASSILGYAGICGVDDLQSNSDPYFSQKSFDQITNYVSGAEPPIDEVQQVALRNFDTNGDSFTLTYQGTTSATITRGTNYSAAGIQAALGGILPAGASVTVENFGGGGAPSDNGFMMTFGGTLAATNVTPLSVTNQSGMIGFVGEIDKGGAIDNGGNSLTPTGNTAPSVSAPTAFTIPYRTPFALTGSATDVDGDTLTYLWEQNDAAPSRSALSNTNKTAGPLFRQFGTPLDSSVYDPQQYNSPGENHPTTVPTRVFPDMAQILANRTNADTGTCGGSGDALRDCLSEWLPTSVYAGPMNFRLTARDNSAGGGGVNSDDTVVSLASGTGPFRVTSPNTAVTLTGGTAQTVTWDVAGTSAPPIATANVEIVMSSDGGASFPHVLAATTPNDGSQSVMIPNLATTQARIMVRAVDNVYFDVSNADFTIEQTADLELVSKTDSQDPAFAGDMLTYTIVARNNGPGQAENARVVDVLPPEVTFVTSSIACVEAPRRTLTCGLGTLAEGEVVMFEITVAIPSDVADAGPITISNTATVSSDREDTAPSNNSRTETTQVRARADMELVSKVESHDPAFAGETLTYTIRARNNGPSSAANARVVDTLPPGTAFVESSVPCVEAPVGTATCDLGTLPPDEQRTFTLTIGIARSVVHDHGGPLTITNTARAASDADDVVPGNDVETESTLVKAKADLDIVSFGAVAPPTELIIGTPQTVTLRAILTNHGPSAPMDVYVARGAGATPNASVSPAFGAHVEAALGYQEERVVNETFEVACTAPGPATFTFANDIDPARPDDVEIDDADNHAATSFTVECIVPVAINIKPGSSKNPLNLKSNGVIPVAVLTTLAGEYGLPIDFDASEIDPLTARFGPEALVVSGGGAHEAHGRGHVEDAMERSDEQTLDGDLDMVLHYRTRETGIGPFDTEACVRGVFGPGYVFHGCDTVTIVP